MKTLLALEPRILFDGAALVTGAEVVQDQITQDHAIPDTDADAETNSSTNMATDSDAFWSAGLSLATPADRREIVFIDTRVENYQTLMDGIDPAAEVVLLDARRDGIEQIAEALNGRSAIDAIHLIGEGTEAEMHLGTAFLTNNSISGHYANLFTQIRQSLSADTDLLIYGCNFGQGEAGQNAMEALAELTGADIAASTDRTGHSTEYADWELEVATGMIETSIVIGEATQATWEGVLATYTVTNTNDAGLGSLRQAILDANANSGTDTIDIPLGTYNLTSGALIIDESVIITGAGAQSTIIDGGGFDRVFQIQNNSTVVTMAGLTIQGGFATDNGAGVFVDNSSTLNLSDAFLTNNNGTGGRGGALHVHGTLNLDRVLISNNFADEGAGIYFHNGVAGSLTNVTISGNTAFNEGGGVWTDTPITMTNSTFTLNDAPNGGGIVTSGATVTISNTIVAGNTASSSNPDLQGNFSTLPGYNLIGDGTGQTDLVDGVDGNQVGTGASPINPMLGALTDNGGSTMTHALLAGSPAINTGTAAGAPVLDQRGAIRDVNVDIGAYEFGAAPGVFMVDTTNDVVDGDTSSVSALLTDKGTDGFISLREAILAVNAGAGGETIILQAGTYDLSLTGTLEDAAATGDLDILKDVTITGAGADTTIIDGNGLDRVFHVLTASGDLTLANVTVQGGDAGTGQGGGILVDTASNQTALTNVVVTANQALDGAGIANFGLLNLTDVEISGNGTLAGTAEGGGLYQAGDATLDRVTISGNQGQRGGGIHNDTSGTNLSLLNVTVSGNNASVKAGGLHTHGVATIVNSTFTLNDANLGGGIVIHGGSVSLKNTIVAGNTASGTDPDAQGVFSSLGNNLIGDDTGTSGWIGSDLLNIAPTLGALTDNGGPTKTHALLGGSPAIDAGTATGAPTVDQRGAIRDANVDIGAFERMGNFSPTLDLDGDNNSGSTGNDYQFTFTEGDAPTAIADIDTDLVDPDSLTFDHVTLSISGLLDGNAETLVLDGDTFALATAVAGQDTTGGNYRVVITTGAGTATVTITKQGGGTFTEIEAETLIEAIQYQHTDTSAPTDGDRLIDVTVNDGALDSAAARTTINVNPMNDDPIITSDGGLATAAVNAAENQTSVTTVTATDVDLPPDTLTYTITGGADQGLFAINSSSGVLTFTSARDFQTFTDANLDGVYEVTVQVADGNGGLDTQAISVTVTDTQISLSASTVDEMSANGTGVGTATTTPADLVTDSTFLGAGTPATFTTYNNGQTFGGWTVTQGKVDLLGSSYDSSPLGGNSVDLGGGITGSGGAPGTISQTLTTVAGQQYQVTFELSGAWFLESSDKDLRVSFDGTFQDITISKPAGWNAATDMKWAQQTLIFTASSSSTVLSFQSLDPAGEGPIVADVQVVADPATFTYSLTDDASGRFAINPTSGLITVANGSLLDYETATSHDITVSVSSGPNLIEESAFTITITPVNESPGFTGLDNTPTFTEGGAAVVLDNNATIADPELDAVNNYNGATLTLVRNGGGNAEDLFNGSGTLLPLVESGPLVVGGTTIGTVTTNSGGTLVLTFNGNATTALVNSALQRITYANNSSTPPANVQVDFAFNDGNAGAQGSGGALNGTGSITVSITSLNTPPVAVTDGFTVNEGSTNVLNLAGNDIDLDDGLDLTSITIVSGPTNGTIDSINAGGTVTYTHNGSETLTDSFTYTIRDLAGATSNTVTVNLIVTPQNDPPIITSNGGGASANVTVITGNTAVTDVEATDAENAPLTYSIIGGADAALFSIDPTTGVLTFITAPDVLAPGDVGGDNIYDVIVQASDGTAVDTQALAVRVTPAIVAPPIFNPPPPDSPPSSDPPPRETGEETSENQAPVSGGSIDPSAPGNVPDGGQGFTTTGLRNSDSGQHLAEHEEAAKPQREEGTGILERLSDMWEGLQKPLDLTTLKGEIHSLLTRHGFLQDLDRVRDDFQGVTATEKTYVASSIAVSTGLSIGYVIWLLRSGVLLTALLSSVPAWQFVNPLLVLDSAAKKKRQKGQKDMEDDSVESLFEKPTASAEIAEEKIGDHAKAPRARWFRRHTR